MNSINLAHSPFSFNRMITLIAGFCLAFLALTAIAEAQTDGFTEPFRRIELSSDESGSIAELLVEEGQFVQANDPIVRLDSRVQELQLEIADQMANARSQLVAAEEALKKREAIFAKLTQLMQDGHASQAEIMRADMELSIAKAKFLSAQEEVAVRVVERRRAEVQLERRTVVAPFDGVVSKIHSREGEFLSPLRPEIVTLVQVNRLIATFAVPATQVTSFTVGKEFNIQLGSSSTGEGHTVLGVVQSIGVETDAQSGTVEIKLVFENPGFRYRSGEICTLNL